jgi:5-methylcytosine-specific restriction enzyme subunit McrC
MLLDHRAPGGRIRLPVDAKYKLYDARRLDPADVYQAFFYAYAYHRPGADPTSQPSALLVYPSSEAGARVALRVRREDGATTARISAIGVHIPATLRAIDNHTIGTLPEVLEVQRVLGHIALASA